MHPIRHPARAVQRVAQLDRAGAGAEGEARMVHSGCCTPAARTAIGPEHDDGVACELENVAAVRVADPDHLLEEDIHHAHHLTKPAAATRGEVLGELGEARDVLPMDAGGGERSKRLPGRPAGQAEQPRPGRGAFWETHRKERNPAAVVAAWRSDGLSRQDALQYDGGHNAGQHARLQSACGKRREAAALGSARWAHHRTPPACARTRCAGPLSRLLRLACIRVVSFHGLDWIGMIALSDAMPWSLIGRAAS